MRRQLMSLVPLSSLASTVPCCCIGLLSLYTWCTHQPVASTPTCPIYEAFGFSCSTYTHVSCTQTELGCRQGTDRGSTLQGFRLLMLEANPHLVHSDRACAGVQAGHGPGLLPARARVVHA